MKESAVSVKRSQERVDGGNTRPFGKGISLGSGLGEITVALHGSLRYRTMSYKFEW